MASSLVRAKVVCLPSHPLVIRMLFLVSLSNDTPNFPTHFAVHQILIPPVTKARHLAEAPEDCYFEVDPPGSDGPSDLQ